MLPQICPCARMVRNTMCCRNKIIGNIKSKEIILQYLEMVQTFYAGPNPEEMIIAHSLLITPDSENTSSDIFVSALNDRKNTSNKKKFSGLSSPQY